MKSRCDDLFTDAAYADCVAVVSDEDGNMNFNGTQMDIQKYGRNDGENRASYYK